MTAGDRVTGNGAGKHVVISAKTDINLTWHNAAPALPAHDGPNNEVADMKPVITLVAIADGARARFYRHSGPGKGIVRAGELDMDGDVPPGRDLKADRPGRAFESATHGRSAYEPKSDPRELVEQEFAEAVIGTIKQELDGGGAGEVVLCAAPATLGHMRKAMPPALEKHLRATLAKDLTKVPPKDLPKHLEGVLAV